MISYLEKNIEFVIDFCRKEIPEIKPLRPDASFLIWLNCRDLGLDHERLVELFKVKAGLALNDGETFNPGGEGFMRMNIACPRKTLEQAMKNLKAAVYQQ